LSFLEMAAKVEEPKAETSPKKGLIFILKRILVF
jgi:hypothetical protein